MAELSNRCPAVEAEQEDPTGLFHLLEHTWWTSGSARISTNEAGIVFDFLEFNSWKLEYIVYRLDQ